MSQTVYSVITANGLLGGVGVWSLRLSEWSSSHPQWPRWVTLVLCSEATEDQTGWFVRSPLPGVVRWDYCSLAKKGALLRRLANQLRDASVVVPNYVVAAWDAVALLRREDPAQSPRVLGVCHSDHALFYRWLRDFRPVIDQAVAVSEACGREVERSCGFSSSEVVTLPYGVPVPKKLPPRRLPPPLRLVYVGRLEQRQKRVHLLVKLCSELAASGVDYRLDVYGEGPAKKDLESLLGRVAGHRAYVHGPLCYGELEHAFTEAHVQLLFSDHEGLPIALLEGMAWGVVPVATAIRSGVPELIQDGMNGFLVPTDDPIPLAVRRLKELAGRAERLTNLALHAAGTVRERYVLEQVAPRWLELVQATAERAASVPDPHWRPPRPEGFGRVTVLDHPWFPSWLSLQLRKLRHRKSRH